MDEYFIEEKSNWDKTLDLLVFVAVFAVTIFLILEFVASMGNSDFNLSKVAAVYFYINIAVFAIFVLDLYRLWGKSENVKDFFSSNWLDILATIPFGLIASMTSGVATKPTFEILKLFRVSKVARFSKLQKVSRVSKVAKEFKAASHLKKEGSEYNKKHRL